MGLSSGELDKRTMIGVLASHDSSAKHKELVETLQILFDNRREYLEKFHLVFTGGTFDRLILGKSECADYIKGETPIWKDPKYKRLRAFLQANSTRLPDRASGGLMLLSNLVIHHQCELLWLFLSPDTPHWVNCQNMALLRLSDQCFTKKYMNAASVLRWADEEAERDVDRNPQAVNPLIVQLGTGEIEGKDLVVNCPVESWNRQCQEKKTNCDSNCNELAKPECPCRPWPRAKWNSDDDHWEIRVPTQDERDWDCYGSLSIALISHDAVKPRMVDFATQYERELMQFRRILTTGTTGSKIKERCHDLRSADKIRLCQSGPYGGDLEIAAEVLFDRCQVVVFFVDPLHPHPHTEDIRVVFSVCMGEPPNNKILMLSNELQSREWFDTVRFLSCAERADSRVWH
jgi:methylglyoxal synthase